MTKVPVLRIVKMIEGRFQNLFAIKDITLISEDKDWWKFELVMIGAFEEITKKININKTAFQIWACLEDGVKWDE